MDKTWIIVLVLCGLMLYGCFWFDRQVKSIESDLAHNRPGSQFLLSK